MKLLSQNFTHAIVLSPRRALFNVAFCRVRRLLRRADCALAYALVAGAVALAVEFGKTVLARFAIAAPEVPARLVHGFDDCKD